MFTPLSLLHSPSRSSDQSRHHESPRVIMSALYALCLIFALFGLSAVAIGSESPPPSDAHVQLVVNAKVSMSSISAKELSYIFSGRRGTWPADGSAIQLILFPDDSREMKWLSRKLRMPPRLIRRFIHHRVYQGTMRSPIEVRSADEALEALTKHRGSITPVQLDSSHLQKLKSDEALSKSVRLIELSQ